MTEMTRLGRSMQLLDDLRKTKGYWKLKKEAEDLKGWKRHFITRKKYKFTTEQNYILKHTANNILNNNNNNNNNNNKFKFSNS